MVASQHFNSIWAACLLGASLLGCGGPSPRSPAPESPFTIRSSIGRKVHLVFKKHHVVARPYVTSADPWAFCTVFVPDEVVTAVEIPGSIDVGEVEWYEWSVGLGMTGKGTVICLKGWQTHGAPKKLSLRYRVGSRLRTVDLAGFREGVATWYTNGGERDLVRIHRAAHPTNILPSAYQFVANPGNRIEGRWLYRSSPEPMVEVVRFISYPKAAGAVVGR